MPKKKGPASYKLVGASPDSPVPQDRSKDETEAQSPEYASESSRPSEIPTQETPEAPSVEKAEPASNGVETPHDTACAEEAEHSSEKRSQGDSGKDAVQGACSGETGSHSAQVGSSAAGGATPEESSAEAAQEAPATKAPLGTTSTDSFHNEAEEKAEVKKEVEKEHTPTSSCPVAGDKPACPKTVSFASDTKQPEVPAEPSS
eukprot:RCo051314